MENIDIQKDQVLRSGNEERIWQKFCGFMDLSIDEFMQIQNELLKKQIDYVADSTLGKHIMLGQNPVGVDNFRSSVPLTTYKDYAEFLEDKNDSALAEKPALWGHTSGRGGCFKWAPFMLRTLELHTDMCVAGLILACTEQHGKVNLTGDERVLCIVAPPPYLTGITNTLLVKRFDFSPMPPPHVADNQDFHKRIATGFNLALRNGTDIIWAVGTVLNKLGEKFTESSSGLKLDPGMLHPAVFFRLMKALIRSKMEGRKILPSDIWKLKGLTCGGTDASVYAKRLEHYFGRPLHQVYGCTESGLAALQSWKKKGLVFHPYLNFLEFIPEKELLKCQEDAGYQPKTVLIDEVQVGEIYELVITNFHGMPFLRYRPGDLFRVVESDEGIELPQFDFHARADGLIDLYNIIRLDERTVWEAINATGIKYEDWTAMKDYEDSWPVLQIYIEPREETNTDTLINAIHHHLLKTSPLYLEAITENEKNPVRVTLLKHGTFSRYMQQQQSKGADLAHLKPLHMNASEESLKHLLECNRDID
ncbi:MAG: GH3 auxin-responsive promoter family protein [Dehalococcoidaceae bacterium]|nr:GH3 auxin-responsive promoter family protein [Dehalococcoidaceae bacterium]